VPYCSYFYHIWFRDQNCVNMHVPHMSDVQDLELLQPVLWDLRFSQHLRYKSWYSKYQHFVGSHCLHLHPEEMLVSYHIIMQHQNSEDHNL